MLDNKIKYLRVITESPFFDADWYKKTYSDISLSNMDPAEHYLRVGWILERNPGPHFSTREYLNSYPELRDKNVCPLVDLAERNLAQSEAPASRKRLPTPTPSQIKAIEVVKSSRLFDADWYAETYPESSHSYVDAATHYVICGADSLLNPGPGFSTRFYFQKHPDIRKAGMNPLMHYEKWGRAEGRAILPAYLDCTATDPALAASRRGGSGPVWQGIGHAQEYLSRILTVGASGEPVRMSQSFDCKQASRFVSAIEKLASEAEEAMDLVSVIMPTYNRASQVGKAIFSVLGQSWSNFELIVVDDGSTDDTAQILESIADPRLSVLHSNRSGVSGARNKGLAHARGEVIFYLDSDNEWTPDFLWLMMHSMRHSGARCGYAGTRLQSPREFLIGYRGEPYDWEACLELNYVDMNVFCHHRDMVTEHGVFDTDLKRMVDWDLILRFTRDETVFYAPFIGCVYHEDSHDMGRITTSQPIVSRKLVHNRNALDCSLQDVTAKLSLNIAIKMFAPYQDREAWGDYHYAESLAEALQRQGHKVRIDFRGQWYEKPVHADDVAIVLRGLEAYQPRATQLNIFWGISHPDTVTPQEYDGYQGIFVASASYAELLKVLLNRPVQTLWQCTDTTRFTPPADTGGDDNATNRGIFIGNSRKEYRQIVRWAVEAGLPLEVIGQDWEDYIPAENILAKNAPNKSLASYYGTAAFVLNDHWQSMRDFGFVSNRVFDVLAAGGRLISDRLPSIEYLFGDAVISVDDGKELQKAVAEGAMTSSSEQRLALAQRIHEQHSFDRRADTLIRWVNNYLVPKAVGEGAADHSISNETLPGNASVGVLAPWGNTQRMGSTIEHLIAPLTTDQAATQIKIVPLETADDCRNAELSAMVISASAFPPSEALLAAVGIRMDEGLPVYLDCNEGPNFNDWGKLAGKYTGIWCHNDTVRSQWSAGSALTMQPRLDPRIWRRYRNPRPIEAAEGPLRLLAVYQAGIDEAEIANIKNMVAQLDRISQVSPNGISLEIIGVDPDQIPKRSWVRSRPWPEDCDTHLRQARLLLDNAFADIGIVTEKDISQKILQFMALGMLPITLTETDDSLAQATDISEAAMISETGNGALLNLLSLIDKPDELLERRKASFDLVWQNFSTLVGDNPKLSALLLSTASVK